jgi:hypothetical protein
MACREWSSARQRLDVVGVDLQFLKNEERLLIGLVVV